MAAAASFTGTHENWTACVEKKKQSKFRLVAGEHEQIVVRRTHLRNNNGGQSSRS